MSYKDTLLLPRTSFPMKANLVRKEPEILKKWEKERVYEKVLKEREGADLFVLHDGPPYANGHIHMGHVINKILKDIIVKSKSMLGYRCPYVPGWDCHGLPIEHNVEKELGREKLTMDKSDVRRLCRRYAERFIEVQKGEFKRLGVFGDWENPYLTMDYEYEADILRELGKFVEKGLLYQEKKPVFWCPSCKTALAMAEVEYQNDKDPSIFVKFDFISYLADLDKCFLGKGVSAVIWTTTPWTIPANMAVCVHPDFDYVFVEVKDRVVYLIAAGLLKSLMREFGVKHFSVLKTVRGVDLEGLVLAHPIYGRESRIVLGEHVTLDAGTGLVHTAPGHGEEDYAVAKRYRIPIYSPVDGDGRFVSELEIFGGEFIFDANRRIIEVLRERGALLGESEVEHSYPHCWRCKSKVIFRATKQWFIDIDKDGLRDRALREIDKTQWIPSWGRNRIHSMMETRPDWCISRQRAWGVPIALFRCRQCGRIQYNRELIDRVAEQMEKRGADVWFEEPPEYFLPDGYVCKCGSKEFEKEEDILDVWFDSGSSHAAVLEKREELRWPADMYLEGSDQHRGWFHSSLLESVGTRGSAPYKSVLTHGFVVDARGRKMSKSLGNVISPESVIKRYGAEILRLWVSATDYREDIRLSEEIMGRLVESYRKIRNTIRFLMGNLHDFDEFKAIDYEDMEEIDRWILAELELFKERLIKAYDEYEFHIIYQYTQNFCVSILSSFYLDVLKDRLYCDAQDSKRRRSAQTAMKMILEVLLVYLAPILSFTSEEAYLEMGGRFDSVHMERFVALNRDHRDDGLVKKWGTIRRIKKATDKAIELVRERKEIGNSLEADLYLRLSGEFSGVLDGFLPEEIADIYLVSHVYFGEGQDVLERYEDEGGRIVVDVVRASGVKCERCWKINESVGGNPDGEPVCSRCYKVLRG